MATWYFRLGAIFAIVLLSLNVIEARISHWRVEFVKCSYLNYELNASRSVQFCGQTPQFFCCQYDEAEDTNRCCTLDELLNEMRFQFYLTNIISWLILVMVALAVLSCVYILIKAKRLLKHVSQSKS